MLTEPQKEHLRKEVKTFLKVLTPDQCQKFYFLLDDILQYGQGTASLFYKEASTFLDR